MSETDKLALTQFARFGLLCLEESRSEFGDLDAFWLEEKATELGLLHNVHVTEPCNDPDNECSNCRCAEWDDFPQDCLRYSPLYDDVVAVLTEPTPAVSEDPRP